MKEETKLKLLYIFAWVLMGGAFIYTVALFVLPIIAVFKLLF